MGKAASACSSLTACSKTATLKQIQPSTDMMRRRGVAKPEPLPFDGKLQEAESTLDPWSSISAESDDVSSDSLAFFRAIADGNLKMVQLILQKASNANLLTTRYRNKETCLHVAVRKRQHQVVEYLLDRMLTYELQAEGSPVCLCIESALQSVLLSISRLLDCSETTLIVKPLLLSTLRWIQWTVDIVSCVI